MDTNLSRTDRTDLHVMEFPHWFHRSDHTHRVAAAILKHGPIARTTLAQDLGLSQGALSRITSDLIYDGVTRAARQTADRAAHPSERAHLRRRQDQRAPGHRGCHRRAQHHRLTPAQPRDRRTDA